MDYRIGNGVDVHKLANDLPFWLGGIRLDCPFGAVAHSDGDCLIHALCDALLGAVALGDIGCHFPDNDPAFRGIDSKILLDRTYKMVRQEGYELSNADCTICLQLPKVAPYIPAMRTCLASVLNVPLSAISIKATTTEHLGFVGELRGIAVYATVLLQKKPANV